MTRRAPGEHRDPLAGSAEPLAGPRPTPGPIAILPTENAAYARAAEAAGGTVAALSEHTRGLVWLDHDGPALEAVLEAHPAILLARSFA